MTAHADGERPKHYMSADLMPPKENLEANSTRRLSRIDVQRAIIDVKRFVENRLESDLHLVKVRYIARRRNRRSFPLCSHKTSLGVCST
jgi:hypothetical protein